jgi:uncharacterized protein
LSLLARALMITQDQTQVVEFLGSPEAHGGAAVERIETHASIVFVAGRHAVKMKRAVRYDYLDFSTLERRRTMCEAEVRINRRTAPQVYHGVVAVTRESDGALALGGSGEPVEWLVDMARFDQNALFDRLATRGELNLDLMGPLATAVARLHQAAERHHDHGGAHGMRWVVEGNARGFAEYGAGVFDAAAWADLILDARTAIEQQSRTLDARRDRGFVRQCHGDLHLRNLVLLEGRPTLFDAVEFNDEIACTDVFYDLAFLLMDLWKRRLPHHANVVWNEYLRATSDVDGTALLPLFLSCRAAVRAKTSATAAALQKNPQRTSELQASARDYLVMARELLHPPPACLLAIGGFSGSGKSTLARRLAPLIGPVPGAAVIRSDEIRKQLCGADPLHRLGPEGYTAEVTRRVYETIVNRGALIARAGHAVIVDAVYARPADREAIERATAAVGASFVGLWLDAPETVLITRTEQRRLDASDADAEVIRRQMSQSTGPISWHRLDASGQLQDVAQAARVLLRDRLTKSVRLESDAA